MNKRIIVIVLMPVLLFACTAFKPVGKLTDKELIDKYYKTDLDLYMVKRDAEKTNLSKPGGAGGYGSRDAEKIKKIEDKLAIMEQELNKRGYIP
jgi:hypothetical protein